MVSNGKGPCAQKEGLKEKKCSLKVQAVRVSDHLTGFCDDAGPVTVDVQLLLNTDSIVWHM
jgi:hypothetical protein